MVRMEKYASDGGHRENSVLAVDAQIKGGRRSGSGLDLVAYSLQRGAYACSGENAGRHNIFAADMRNLFEEIVFERILQDLAVELQLQVFGLAKIQVVVKILKVVRNLDRITGGVMHAIGDNQHIAGVLVEMLVRFDKKRKRGRVPDHLVNADNARRAIRRAEQVSQPHQENSIAVDGIRINGAVERDRQPGLIIEAVQLVEERDIKTIRRISGAVGRRQVYTQKGVLAEVHYCKAVAGKRRLRG